MMSLSSRLALLEKNRKRLESERYFDHFHELFILRSKIEGSGVKSIPLCSGLGGIDKGDR